MRAWVLPPVALGRVAVLRSLVYAVVAVTVLVVDHSVGHGSTPSLWKPVTPLRLLHVAAPGTVQLRTLQLLLGACAVVAASGRLSRVLGWPVAFLYLLWQAYEMSYGKVDHDQYLMLVALFVLPTVPAAAPSDLRSSEEAGFAYRCLTLGAAATYAFSAWAKIRFGGWHWPNGAVFTWSLVRRGHPWSSWLLHYPTVLHASQWGLLLLEVSAPLLFLGPQRRARVGAVVFLVFHVTTYLAIGISFLPTMVCLLGVFPLERLRLPPVRAVAVPAPAS